MRKLTNAFAEKEDYNCFGCSPRNPIGLKMNFYEDGNQIISKWKPDKNYAGFKNILHGGIQSTIMDEIAGWVVFTKIKTAGFTISMNIKLKKQVYTDKGEITAKAELKGIRRNIAQIGAVLYNQKNEAACIADINYFLYPEDKAKEIFDFPDAEDFFK